MFNKNCILFYAQEVLTGCVTLLMTGTVIQNFLIESGCSNQQVSNYISIMQMVQMVTMLLLSEKMEHTKNIFRSIVGTYVMQIPLFAAMLFLSVKPEVPVDMKYMFLFAISFVANMFYGLNIIVRYKLPYYILDMSKYGQVTGISGILLGIVGVLFASILSFCVRRYLYFDTMAWFSGIGILFVIMAAVLTLGLHPVSNRMELKKKEKAKNLFHYKPFFQLLLPNLLRGVSTGIFLMMAVIGYSSEILDSVGTSKLVTLSQVGIIVGCALYSFCSVRIKDGVLIMAAGIFFCLTLPIMMNKHSQNIFLIVYFIAYLSYNCINYAVPVLVAKNIDYDYVGQYSAWRMAIHTLGAAIGSAIVPALINCFEEIGCLVVCGITMLLCGICFYRFEKRKLFKLGEV